jgi:opacity protein-like surface antigen
MNSRGGFRLFVFSGFRSIRTLNWERHCTMRAKNLAVILLWVGLTLVCTASRAQTDLAASIYGAFNGTTNGNGVQQSPSNSAGVLLELRHIRNPLVGFEATYAYNRANQTYTSTAGANHVCQNCTVPTLATIKNNVHEVTADWVVSLPLGSFKPFALAGGGLLINDPSGGSVTVQQCGSTPGSCTGSTGSASSNSSKQGVFVYGAGLDWTVLPHLGLRFQYRGNLYKAADLTSAFSSTNAFTHTAEPMVGAFLRF